MFGQLISRQSLSAMVADLLRAQVAPSFATIKTFTPSPDPSSGTPMQAHSNTPHMGRPPSKKPKQLTVTAKTWYTGNAVMTRSPCPHRPSNQEPLSGLPKSTSTDLYLTSDKVTEPSFLLRTLAPTIIGERTGLNGGA